MNYNWEKNTGFGTIATSSVILTNLTWFTNWILFLYCRTDGTESPILGETDADAHSDKPKPKYGELVILG